MKKKVRRKQLNEVWGLSRLERKYHDGKGQTIWRQVCATVIKSPAVLQCGPKPSVTSAI